MPKDDDVEHLLEECKTIEEHCLYTSQAHFVLVERRSRHALWLVLGPSIVAAVAGVLTAVGLPGWIGAFAAAAGVVTGVAGFVGVDAKPHAHRLAANALTVLRHEARTLRETFAKELSRKDLADEVRRLSAKYNSLIVGLEPTDNKAFEEARKRIKAGRFVPDHREEAKALLPPPSAESPKPS